MTMVSIKENRDTGIIRPLMEANIVEIQDLEVSWTKCRCFLVQKYA
jgi:hypothetical protein